MKTTILKKLFLGVFFSVFLTTSTFSQTYKTDGDGSSKNQNLVKGQNVSPEMLANLGIITNPNPRNALVQGNSVYLQQIGGYNMAQIQTRTNASDIKLTQDGDYNDTYIDYTANTAVADLVQKGDNNRIVDFVNDPNADISLELIQEGNNLNFERDGVNELTKSLKFRQTEASPTIIVRSFY